MPNKKKIPKYPCGSCGDECNLNTLQCSGCFKWFHQLCSGVPAPVVTYLGSVKGLMWRCEPCIIESHNRNNEAPLLFQKKFEEISKQLNEVKDQLTEMKTEKETVVTPNNVVQQSMSEVTKKSIRVSGLPESSEDNVYKRKTDDIKKVKNIALKLGFEELRINGVIRAGKYDPDKDRTLIVELTSRTDAELLVSKAILDKFGTKNNVYISPDLTREERLEERKVLKKRRELINTGTDKNSIKIRNLKLLVDGVVVPV